MRRLVMALAATFLLSAARADAALLTYTETATLSGSLGTMNFTDAQVSISGIGDTSGIVSVAPGVFNLNLSSASVSVNGVTAAFTDQVLVVDNRGGNTIGFGNVTTGLSILLELSPAFSTYDLSTPYGPILGPPSSNSAVSQTTAGAFTITDSRGTATFTAVPEPSSLALTGLAGLGLLGWAHRRRSA